MKFTNLTQRSKVMGVAVVVALVFCRSVFAQQPHTLTGDIRFHKSFHSKILNNDRDVVVYLPPGYESNKSKRYAVLYLNDGQNLFDGATSFIPGKEWRVDETAQALITVGKIEPLIIVGINFVTGYGGNNLYRNNGDGTFTDVTSKLSVGGGGWSTSAGWFDYDRDGRLDLFVARYVEWDFDLGSVYCGEMKPGYRAFCHPDNFKGATNILYHQRADGTFEDVSAKSGIVAPGGKALGVAFGDFDNDGLMDVFVANDIYHNDRDLTFTYATNSAGVGQITLSFSGWGARFIDADNDGLRDIFVAQSHVLDTIEKTNPYLKYRQTPLLMLNTGKGFVNVSFTAGTCFGNPIIGRGAAFGDLNNDGQVDVVVAALEGSPVLLRNNGTKNHWLGLSLVGSKSNRNGIGARITVTDSADKKQIFDANTSGSYLSSNDPRIVVGLGAASAVRKVEVVWPSGVVQVLTEPQIDRYLVVNEKDARK